MKKFILFISLFILLKGNAVGQTPSNLSVDSINFTSAVLQWQNGTCASLDYILEYKDSTQNNWISDTVLNNSFTGNYSLNNLNTGTTYNWRVKCDSIWENGINFSTISCNLQDSVDIINTSCPNSNNGHADVTVWGGTPPYSFSWQNNYSGEDLIDVGPGTYYVTISDINGCSLIDTIIISSNNDSTSINQYMSDFTINPVTSYGMPTYDTLSITNIGCDVNIRPEFIISHDSLAISHGDIEIKFYNPIFQFWANIPYNINSNGDAYGHWHTTSNTSNDSTGYTFSFGSTQSIIIRVRFNNNSTNTANYGNYTCSWVTNEVDFFGNLLRPLCPVDTAELLFSNCNAFLIDSIATINTSCSGSSDGAANLISILGGSGNYSYLWSNGDTNSSISNLLDGNYTLTVNDNYYQCSDSKTITILDEIHQINFNSTPPLCNGDSNGSITATPNESGSFSYLWSNGATSATISNLSSGTYILSSTNNNCNETRTDTIALTNPDVLTHNPYFSDNITCDSLNCYGIISLNLIGGTQPYSFSWNTGDTTSGLNNACGGTYIVTSTDANFCNTFTDTIIITDSLTTLSSTTTLSSDNISCFGANDGSATAYSSSGSGGTQSLLSYCASGPLSGNNINIQNVNLVGDGDSIQNYTPGTDQYEDYTYMYTSLTPNQSYDLTIQMNNISGLPNYQSGAKVYIDWNTDGDFDDSGEEVGVINNDTLPTTTTLSFTVPNSFTNFVTRMRIVSQLNEDVNIGPCEFGDFTSLYPFYGATEDYSLVINATPPSTYIWSNGATTSSISNLSAGVYYCTAIDASGCSTNDSVTITEPTQLIYTLNYSPILCNGQDASASLTISGGSPFSGGTYNVNWQGSNPNRLSAGTHYFTITDSSACTVSDTLIITEPLLLTVNTSIISIPTCFGANDGVISALANGGTGSLSYMWTNNINNDTTYNDTVFTAIAARYTCTVTDSNGCIINSALLNVSQPGNISAQITNTNVSCNGLSDGATTLNITGGDQNYTINAFGQTLPLLGLTTFSSPVGIPAGSYPFSISDGNGCIMFDTIIITEPDTFNITSNITNISCFGLNDGTVSLNILGGTAPFFEDWGNSDSSALTPGNHYFTLTDINGCSTSDSISVSEPTELISSISYTDVSCYGLNDGTATLTISGGTPSYTENWRGSNPLNLSAGIYNYSIIDSNGCTISDSITINQPSEITTNLIITDVLCKGENSGSASLIISGGTPSYSEDWGSFNPSALYAGNYIYSITDSNGCFFSDSLSINEPDSQLNSSITSVNLTTCFSSDGSINLSVIGGISPYSFMWNNNDTIQNPINLHAGNYSVEITDSNGCVSVNNVFVDQPSNGLTLSLTPSNFNGFAISCFGGSNGNITANSIGGNAYTSFIWSNNDTSNFIDNLVASSYSVTVTDSIGCSLTDSILINSPEEITSTFTTTDVSCFGDTTGSATVIFNGGVTDYLLSWGPFTYPLFNSNNIFTTPVGVPAGLYPYGVTDLNGCSMFDTIIINQPDSLIRTVSVSNYNGYNISCFGGSDGYINLEISGGSIPYQSFVNGNIINSPIDSLFNLNQNTYLDSTVDAKGCLITGRTTFSQPQEFILSTTVISNVSCNSGCDGEIAISHTGGVAPYNYYEWANMSLNISVFYPDTTLNNNNLGNLCAGEYTIMASDGNGCMSIVYDSTSVISEPLDIIVNLDSLINIDTFGFNSGSISISLDTISPNTNYFWTGPNNFTSSDQDISNLFAGTYILNTTDSLGCALDTFIVEEPLSLASYLDNIIHNICWSKNEGEINITPDGGDSVYNFLWTGPYGFTSTDEDIDSLIAGIYTLELSDTTNTITYQYEVLEPNELVVYSTGATANCYNGSATATAYGFGGTSPYQTLWTNGSTSVSTVLSVGTHGVTVTDNNGCSSTDSVEIIQADSISIVPITSMVSCNGLQNGTVQLIVFSGGNSPYQYSDDNGASFQTTNTFYNLSPGTSTFMVLDNNGCSNDIQINITEPLELSIDINNTYLSCYGDCDATATAMVSNGTQPYFYLWSDPSNQLSQTASGLCSGSFNVTVTDNNGCVSTELITIIEPQPILVNIWQYDDMLEATSGFISYQWLDEQLNPIIGEISNEFYPTSPGEYSVEVTDSNGCSTISYAISFVASSVNFNDITFEVYPNPTTNYINIDGATLISEIEVYNTIGDNVISISNNLSANRIKIDLSNQPKGIYFLRINHSKQLINHKIVLQ